MRESGLSPLSLFALAAMAAELAHEERPRLPFVPPIAGIEAALVRPPGLTDTNLEWSRVTQCEGKVTWALGTGHRTHYRGPAQSWGEAKRHVAELKERMGRNA